MIDLEKLNELIESGESVEVEFKSDKQRLSDNDMYEIVVAFANTDGGVLLIGVEDDGKVTGARPRHNNMTDSLKIQSAIFNNTVPSINTRVSVIEHPDGPVIAIEVDRYPDICSNKSGRVLRRAVAADGKPATLPFYPHEQLSRKIDLGLQDYSAQVLENNSFEDFDPLQFERLRQMITRLRGDKTLLELSDEELAKALKLVEYRGDKLIPNVAGLLLLGRRETIEKVIPTHKVYFQVIDARLDVRMNDCFTHPLLQTLEEIESRFAARNEESEIMVGFIRLPVPDYSPIGFREAVNNAVLHRDYTKMDFVYVQWQHDNITITNPGSFPPGISPQNILTRGPKPRNPLLAEAFKRIGIIEQTGRGVDKIYWGQMQYGRPAPDYSGSDKENVRVVLDGGKTSLQFAAFVFEQDKTTRPLILEEVMVLNHLFLNRRADSTEISKILQRDVSRVGGILEKLVERGLIRAKGEKRGRVYMLDPSVYERFGEPWGYVRSVNFEPFRQEQMILQAVETYGKINRSQVSDLCGISKNQASKLLYKMVNKGLLKKCGESKKNTYYVGIKGVQ